MLGHLGPSAVEAYVEHGKAHCRAAGVAAGGRWCDLGSGAGLPGLILALEAESIEVLLLDRSTARCEFLRWAVVELMVADRVSVLCAEAADTASSSTYMGSFDGVVSRSFGSPPLVAEIAGALLKPGGRLVVSEPPDGGGRWPDEGLQRTGLSMVDVVIGPPGFVVLERTSAKQRPCRSWNRMRRQPLF